MPKHHPFRVEKLEEGTAVKVLPCERRVKNGGSDEHMNPKRMEYRSKHGGRREKRGGRVKVFYGKRTLGSGRAGKRGKGS